MGDLMPPATGRFIQSPRPARDPGRWNPRAERFGGRRVVQNKWSQPYTWLAKILNSRADRGSSRRRHHSRGTHQLLRHPPRRHRAQRRRPQRRRMGPRDTRHRERRTDDATNANSSAADEAAAGMEATEVARMEATSVEPAEAEAIDEKCRPPVAACQLAFEHVDVEG